MPAEHDAFSLLGRTSRGWFCNKAHHQVIVLFKGGGFASECEGGETGKEGGEELKTEGGGKRGGDLYCWSSRHAGVIWEGMLSKGSLCAPKRMNIKKKKNTLKFCYRSFSEKTIL